MYKGASPVAQLVKNPPATRETWVCSLGWKIPWRKAWQLTLVFLYFPSGSAGKESACNVGSLGGAHPCLGAGPGIGGGVAPPPPLSSSRGSSQPRDRTHVSHVAGGFFTS